MAPDDNRVIHYDWSQVGLPDGYTREELASLEFLDAAQDFVLYGQTGRGKTHLAIAIGAVAVARGKAVRFYT
ncbi:MAG: ATP-binding protein, partial [Parolsenella sp.]|uniref:ATP-binding protein n=1 Tax=Parolsenella sp. TaxID=2083006 RepID=UPI002E78EF60